MSLNSNRGPYKLAAILGILPGCTVFASIVGDTLGQPLFQAAIERLKVIIIMNIALGATFGFAFPSGSWKWGVWVNISTLVVIIFISLIFITHSIPKNQSLLSFCLWWYGIPAVSIVSACIGAYAGAWLSPWRK